MPPSDDKIVIYKLTFPSGKLYIGQTKNLEKRIKRHIRASRENINRPLYDAIRHYGENSFSVDVLEECTIQNVDEREVYYIKTFDTQVKNGYNLDGGGRSNRLISDITRKKLSDNAKQKYLLTGKTSTTGKKYTDEERENISKFLRGRKLSPEHIKKMSERNKGELNPMYGVHRCGKDAPMYGKHLSKEQKKVISDRAKLRIGDKNSFYGKKHRPESFMSDKRIVLCFDEKTNILIGEYANQAIASRETGIDNGKISRCCNGKMNSIKGFIFRYKIER